MPRAPQPWNKRADRTRTSILMAAEAHFAARGYAGTRLEDVADDVGIRRPSVVYHFRSKAELYVAVFSQVLADLRSRYARALIPPATPAERIERLYDAWLQFCVERPAFLRLLMREVSGGSVVPPRELQQLLQAVLEPVRAALDAGQRAGALREVEPTYLISAIAGMSVFVLIAAPAMVPEAYPHGLQPAHVERLRADLLRLSGMRRGPHRVTNRRKEDR